MIGEEVDMTQNSVDESIRESIYASRRRVELYQSDSGFRVVDQTIAKYSLERLHATEEIIKMVTIVKDDIHKELQDKLVIAREYVEQLEILVSRVDLDVVAVEMLIDEKERLERIINTTHEIPKIVDVETGGG